MKESLVAAVTPGRSEEATAWAWARILGFRV